jgi:hypothetical protein
MPVIPEEAMKEITQKDQEAQLAETSGGML